MSIYELLINIWASATDIRWGDECRSVGDLLKYMSPCVNESCSLSKTSV